MGKRLLFTLFAILFCSTMFGQNYYVPVNTGQYSTSTTIISVISFDGVEQGKELELGVFCNDEVRASVRTSYNPVRKRYIATVSVKGQSGDAFKFKVYDHSTKTEWSNDCTITYVDKNGVTKVAQYLTFDSENGYGSSTQPCTINFNAPLHWIPNTSFDNAMIVSSTVKIDNITQQNSGYELGVFCGDEVRGSAELNNDGTVNAIVYGVAGEVFTFNLYDPNKGEGFDNNGELIFTEVNNITFNQDGYFNLEVNFITASYVAQIGENKYTTFEKAYEAAQDNDDIILLDDITLEENPTVVSKDININLNSKTVSGTIKLAHTGATVTGVAEAMTVTSGVEGYIVVCENNVYSLSERQPSGKVAYRAYINDSESREAVQVDLTNVYAKTSFVVELLDANDNVLTTTSLKAGKVNAESYTCNIVLEGTASGSWDTEIKASKLTVANIPATINVYADETLVDTYANALGAGTNVDETEKYKALDCVYKEAKIGETLYATFAAAYEEAATGNEIILLANVDFAETTVSKDININLNNNTVTGTIVLANTDATVTCAEGAVTVTTNVAGYEVVYDANAYKLVRRQASAEVAYRAYVHDTDSYEGVAVDLVNVYAEQSLKVELYSGEQLLTSTTYAMDNYPIDADEFTCLIVLDGTDDVYWNTTIECSELTVANIPTTIKVYADDNLVDTYANALGAGTNVDETEDYKALDCVYKEAKIGETLYATFAAAYEAAATGNEIILLADVDFAETTVEKAININLNSMTVTGTIVLANTGATVTCAEGAVTVTTNVAGYEVVYDANAYKLVRRQASAEVAYRAYVHDTDSYEGVAVDLANVYAEQSLKVELYSGEQLLTSTTYAMDNYPIDADEFTCLIVLDGTADEYWNTTIECSELTVANIPTTIKVYADDNLVDTYANALGAGTNVDETEDYKALDCVYKEAKIGETLYATFAAAYEAAATDNEIILLADVDFAETTVEKAININLNSMTVTGTIVLANTGATVTCAEGAVNVTTSLAGYEVVYESGVYKLVRRQSSAEVAYRAYVHDTDSYEGVAVDLANVYAEQSLKVELYSGEQLLTSTTYAMDNYPIDADEFTCLIVLDGTADEYWNTTIECSELTVANIPTTIKVYADGTWVNTYNNALGAETNVDETEDYKALDCVLDTPVAKVGNTEYYNINNAIANWTAGSTLTLLEDVTLSDVITLKSTEHHILNLDTYTMTAAEGKNAIEIKSYGFENRNERAALTIMADETNPDEIGTIDAGAKSCIYYKYDATLAGDKYDRPIIYIEGGVYEGLSSSGISSTGHSTAQDKCATFNISGGTFNCGLNLTKTKLLTSGGLFNKSVSCTGGSTSIRLISGGTFESWGWMTADAASKFAVGTAISQYNVGVYVDDKGYLVVGGPVITEAGTTFKASTANHKGWNASGYLEYSSAATNGLYYTSAIECLKDNDKTSGSVNIYTDELDLRSLNYKGTLVIEDDLTVTFNEGTEPAWSVVAKEDGKIVVYTDDIENGIVKRTYSVIVPVAKIGDDKFFASLEAAIAAAQANETITMLADVTLSETLTIEKAITLNLNNKTVTGADDAIVFNVKAAIKIENGTIDIQINLTAVGSTVEGSEDLNVVSGLDDYGVNYYNGVYSLVQIVTQSQTLSAGWNWFSSYIDINGTTGLAKLQNALGTNGIQIKGNNSFTNYTGVEECPWYGSLTSTSVKEMYMIKVKDNHSLQMTGELVDPAQNAITLVHGWNWIGYQLNTELSVSVAIKEPKDGDRIKSHQGFSQYYNNASYVGWWGTLETMTPGYGYMYYNANEDDATLEYSYPADGSKSEVRANITSENNYWVPASSRYAGNMNIVAMLEADGDNYEIAAFVGGEVRGSARPIYVEPLDAYMFFLTIHGDEVEEMSFRVYDLATGEEYDLNDRMNYTDNAIVGSITEPYIFRGTVGVGETSLGEINVYPNPTTIGTEINLGTECDTVEVFNALGVKVAEYQNVDTVDALETAGVYVIRITNNGNVQNCRLIVK